MFTEKRIAEFSTRSCLFSLLGMGTDYEEMLPQKVCDSSRDETGRLYLFPWTSQLVCSQGMPTSVRMLKNRIVGRRNVGGQHHFHISVIG